MVSFLSVCDVCLSVCVGFGQEDQFAVLVITCKASGVGETASFRCYNFITLGKDGGFQYLNCQLG